MNMKSLVKILSLLGVDATYEKIQSVYFQESTSVELKPLGLESISEKAQWTFISADPNAKQTPNWFGDTGFPLNVHRDEVTSKLQFERVDYGWLTKLKKLFDKIGPKPLNFIDECNENQVHQAEMCVVSVLFFPPQYFQWFIQ